MPVVLSKPFFSSLSRRSTLFGVGGAAAIVGAFALLRSLTKPSVSKRPSAVHKPKDKEGKEGSGSNGSKAKVAVDGAFIRRLIRILRIAIPSLYSRETLHLLALTVLLFLRTILSIKVADVMGDNAKFLVERNKGAFIRGILQLGAWAIPASVVNAGLHMEEDLLALCFRHRLTSSFHANYLSGANNAFYHASSTVAHADSRIAQDVSLFSTALANLYANIFKPVLDVVLFTYKLSFVVGIRGPIAMVLYYLMSGLLMRTVMPNFAKLTATRQSLESEFRAAHSHLIACAEEVAFYGGADRERTILDSLFYKLVKFSKRLYGLQFVMEIANSFLVKYGATMVGYGVCALPVFFTRVPAGGISHAAKSSTQLTQDYVRNSQLLINLARAIGALVLLYKRVTALAGYTSRVSELMEQMSSLVPRQTSPATSGAAADAGFGSMIEEENGTSIQVSHCDIVAPDGSMLLRDLSFEVAQGVNVVVVGPNGCGKSSMFRVIAGLWPVRPATGMIRKPKSSDRKVMFYVPQKPYFASGSLRDQILYPNPAPSTGRDALDKELLALLEDVQLSYIVDREGGLDSVKDWYAVLSGGEKQRLAMARLYYHRPKFAVLDECTSAVSDDMRHRLYALCREKGITVFSVAHQRELYKHHQRMIRFDGKGGYEWIVLDSDTLAKMMQPSH